MRILVTIVCIFTPILGWIALIFFMDAWSKQDAAKAQIAQLKSAGIKIPSEPVSIAGAITGTLLAIVMLVIWVPLLWMIFTS